MGLRSAQARTLHNAKSLDRILSMTFFRSAHLQRTVALLFVLTGLSSQIQVVFACDLMDGKSSTVCCCGDDMSGGCEMGGGCPMEEGIQSGAGCCEISVDTLSDVTMGASGSAAGQVTLLDAPRPPPLPLFNVAAAATFALRFSALPSSPFRAPVTSNGAAVYLVTNRIRI
jgi:hypothetical protein